MSGAKGTEDALQTHQGVFLPECSPDVLSDWSWLDNLSPAEPLLLELPPPASSLESLAAVMATSDITLSASDYLENLPRELDVYGQGEYLSPEAKCRAQSRRLDHLSAPRFSVSSPFHPPKKDRQKLVRYAEDILVKHFPLRAVGDQLYLCENCIWKPVSVNQLWRHLRASDLTQFLDVDSFTDYEAKDLYRRLVTNEAIQLDDTNGGPMDSTEEYINLRDICFHVTTGQCCPQDPGYFFTSNLDISKTDLATNQAPAFDEFVQTSLAGDPALRQLLLEILGTLLSNYRPKNIFAFCGASNSGKSVIVDFLRWIIGVPSITQIAHLRDFSSRWTIGNLKGKKLLICTECSDESIGPDACAVIKTITGEPTLTGEQKHKDATTFTNTTRLLLVSNHLVRLDRVDAGFANRLVTLPFPCSIPFEQQDPDLLQHLLEEKGAIFNMAMQELNELVSRNFEYTKANPDYLGRISDQKLYIAENFDAGVKQFVDDCCTLEAGSYLASSTLYESYREFAEAQYLPFYTKSDVFCKALYRLFPALGSKKKYVSGKQTRCVEGISLTNISSETLPKEDISYE